MEQGNSELKIEFRTTTRWILNPRLSLGNMSRKVTTVTLIKVKNEIWKKKNLLREAEVQEHIVHVKRL